MAQSYEKHYSNQKPCDGKKLRELILGKGMSIAEAGEAIGMSKSGLTNPCTRNTISPHIVLLVEHVLGIPFSDYEVKEPEPEPTPEPKPEEKHEEKPTEEQKRDTYKTVVTACYAAVQSFCNNDLEPIIKNAVTSALREYTTRR